MNRQWAAPRTGFTIVELLIVIVVIAILAAISVVAYTGIQQRASKATLNSDLSNAARQVELAKVEDEEDPTGLPASVKPSSGNVLQLAADSDGGLCINGYGAQGIVASYSLQGGLREYLCGGALIGSPVGGSLPEVPIGQNLVSDFSTWTLSGGVSYNASEKKIVFNGTTGYARSPLIRLNGAPRAKLTVEAYATQPSPNRTPDGGVYFTSEYLKADGVTPATNTSGHTSNGNAQTLPLSSWQSFFWNTPTGADVMYVRFYIRSSPSNYTSDNQYRNPIITAEN